MDRRTILAIVLSALVLVFVPMIVEKLGLVPGRAARSSKPQPVATQTTQPPGTTAPSAPGETPAPTAGAKSAFANALAAPARLVTVGNNLYDATFDSRGARLVGITLKRYKSVEDGPVRLAGFPSVTVELGDDPARRFLADAVYEVSESTDTEGRTRGVRFSAADSSGLRVVQTYTLDPTRYLIDLEIRMNGAVARGFTDYQLRLQSWPLVTERNHREDLTNLQTVSRVGTELFRHHVGDLKKAARVHEGAVGWVAVRSKYFTLAAIPEGASAKATRSFVPPSDPGADSAFARAIASSAVGGAPNERVAAALVLPVPPSGAAHRLRIYAGPNDYWALAKIGSHLEDVVDLGWRWLLPFSRAILRIMVFLHGFIPNYGLVIIVLSALVRVAFHPLTASSMKSMRAMQRIQPEIERLRKRYEKDPQKLNQAIFQIYKENKVNPLGGCLPLVVQMPVLFSLYQVFLHAIELRQSPFFAWINDLSAPDVLFHVAGFPIRILPVIMGLSAWLQQRMTPTDPRQVLNVQLMNVFLLVLFYNLPSGLVLYWTITNLLTAAQQYLVTHGERAPQVKAA